MLCMSHNQSLLHLSRSRCLKTEYTGSRSTVLFFSVVFINLIRSIPYSSLSSRPFGCIACISPFFLFPEISVIWKVIGIGSFVCEINSMDAPSIRNLALDPQPCSIDAQYPSICSRAAVLSNVHAGKLTNPTIQRYFTHLNMLFLFIFTHYIYLHFSRSNALNSFLVGSRIIVPFSDVNFCSVMRSAVYLKYNVSSTPMLYATKLPRRLFPVTESILNSGVPLGPVVGSMRYRRESLRVICASLLASQPNEMKAHSPSRLFVGLTLLGPQATSNIEMAAKVNKSFTATTLYQI
jgi:hypothetical protein